MSRPRDLPRRLGDILSPALDKLAGSDEARAYAAWARAVGEPVTRGTRPKAFRRGQLTVECGSSVWANELTYLGPQILRRMDELMPGHPVRRFRFVVGRLPAPDAGADEASHAAPHPGLPSTSQRPATGPAEGAGQDSPGGSPKEKRRNDQPAHGSDAAARVRVEEVEDGRLRAAVEAALRRSSEEPREAPGRRTPSG